jgi:DNA invertase Pin-like site-specific DNA recombinase
LRAAGCSGRNIYREKVTGRRADRRELLRMLKRLAPGDVVTLTRIDRPARSTLDLFGIVKRIVDAKAQFRSLAEPWADTGTRTGEGRSHAKAQGKPMGRPPFPDTGAAERATRQREQGATLQELANSYDRRPQHIDHAPRHPYRV